MAIIFSQVDLFLVNLSSAFPQGNKFKILKKPNLMLLLLGMLENSRLDVIKTVLRHNLKNSTSIGSKMLYCLLKFIIFKSSMVCKEYCLYCYLIDSKRAFIAIIRTEAKESFQSTTNKNPYLRYQSSALHFYNCTVSHTGHY